MSELEATKVRAAEPIDVLRWATNYSDEYVGALEKSQEDVPKLVTVLETMLDKCKAELAEHQEGKQNLTEYDQLVVAGRAEFAEEIIRTITEGLT